MFFIAQDIVAFDMIVEACWLLNDLYLFIFLIIFGLLIIVGCNQTVSDHFLSVYLDYLFDFNYFWWFVFGTFGSLASCVLLGLDL